MTNQETNPSNKKVASKKQQSAHNGKSKKLLKILSVVAAVILVLGVLSVVVYNFKHFFVVGSVDGRLITRMELNKVLLDAYGKVGFDELITEKIVEKEIAEKGITVSRAQLNERKKKISAQIEEGQRMTLEQYLKMQGIPEAKFDTNITQQLSVEMLFADKVDVSEEEIDTFLETYGEQLAEGTDEEKRAQVVDILISQQMGTLFQQWLEDAKSRAEISNYLE